MEHFKAPYIYNLNKNWTENNCGKTVLPYFYLYFSFVNPDLFLRIQINFTGQIFEKHLPKIKNVGIFALLNRIFIYTSFIKEFFF